MWSEVKSYFVPWAAMAYPLGISVGENWDSAVGYQLATGWTTKGSEFESR
jgi:hypothetical protein